MTSTIRLRHSGSALAHSVSPAAWRNSFAIRPADAVFAPAMKVGVAAALVLVAGGLLGHEQLAGIASLGALTSAFGRYQPYGRTARMLAIVAAAMVAAAGVGALLGAAGTPLALQILVLSAIAGLASHVFTAFRITGPGPVILVFAAAAGSGFSHTFAAVPQVLAAVFLGSAVGWLVALAPVLVVPMGPARLATARAIAAVVRHGASSGAAGRDRGDRGMHDGGASRSAAESALRSARDSVALSTPAGNARGARTAGLRRQAVQLYGLLDEAKSALERVGTGGETAALARLAGHEAALRATPRTHAAPAGLPSAGAEAAAKAEAPGFLTSARAGLLSRGSAHQALRMAAASALSGWAALALGLGHPLWASMGAVAALQGLGYSVTVQRSIQRLVGNVAGAVVAMALLSLSLGFWPSVAVVVVFQVCAEMVVLKNYTLTTMAVTPMALLMTGLGAHLGPEAAINRVADTLIGVVAGVLVAAISISLADRAHLKPAN